MFSSYESRTKVDYSEKTDYSHVQMELISYDNVWTARTTVVQKHELKMEDNMINPFESLSAEHEYLSVYQSDVDMNLPSPGHYFVIINQLQIEKRIRYSFWKAIEDIGGFHDGLTLLFTLFLAPISAIFFENDLLTGNLFTQHLSQK